MILLIFTFIFSRFRIIKVITIATTFVSMSNTGTQSKELSPFTKTKVNTTDIPLLMT